MSSNEFRPTTSATVEGTAAPTDRPTTNFHPDPPSETVAPTQVSTPPQQAATQPESGGVQHTIVVQQPKPSFNQQVVGYAKEIRGTLLRKPETKEEGVKIRHGEETWSPKDNTESSPTQTTGPSQ
ncbi:hypothetical protein C8Q80DRAFT_1151719 [Daedaleopsis nitida]|nr:hypothetical protein C8Q80DRAFT_1151719 [Daedaleopsis nitida]